MPSDFSILGLPDNATLAQARAARRRLMRKHHPDLAGGSPDAERRTAQINAAFDRIEKSYEAPAPKAQSDEPSWRVTDAVLQRMKNEAIEAMVSGGFLDRITDFAPDDLPEIHFVDYFVLEDTVLTVHLETSASDGRNVIFFPRPSFPAGNLTRVTASTARFEMVDIQLSRKDRSLKLGTYTAPSGEKLQVNVEFNPKGGTYKPSIHRVLSEAHAERKLSLQMADAIQRASAKTSKGGLAGRMKSIFGMA